MPTPRADSYPGTPGTTIYGGLPAVPPPDETLLTTLTLVNESGSAQSSGFVSRMFGMPLKQGDVVAGSYPKFTLADDTPCPATIWGVTTWPDGSMKFCGAMIRVPSTVAGSGTLTINVKSGGTAPAASARSAADLTAADLSVVLTGVTNLSGDWTASLNTAITDADDIVVIGDGPAGKVWRIGGPLKQSGSAHGQLHCWHYVAALQDGSGGLLGLRYLGRVAQPWTDVTSPAVAKRVMTATFKSGASTLRSLQGIQSNQSVGSNITLPHYADFFTCGTDGRWDFVQGGGSASADCTVRVQHNKTYLTKTRLIPPYDLTLSPTSRSSVDYYAQCKGDHENYNMAGTGERREIGVLPTWVACHVMTQSAVDERAVRVSGLASGGWRVGLRRSTTGQVVPCVDVSASYTGLGTILPTARYWSAGVGSGVNDRPETHLWDSEYEPSHRTSATYYPYLVTGEPQYLDLLTEQAAEMIIQGATGGSTWRVGTPLTSLLTASWAGDRNPSINGTTYKGAGVFFMYENLLRLPAWGTRDIAQAAAIYPDTCPAGTETRKYLREVIFSAYSGVKAYIEALSSARQASGIFSVIPDGASAANYEASWTMGYFSNSICHQSSILDQADALYLRQFLSKYWEGIAAAGDFAAAPSFHTSHWKGNGQMAESVSELTFLLEGNLSWSSTDSRFTTTDSWNPTNGDLFSFSTQESGAVKPFTDLANNTRLYVVNASGKTFQLSETLGGSPKTVPLTGSTGVWFCSLADAGSIYSFQGFGGASSYVANVYGAVRHHLAAGDSNVSAARTAGDQNLTDSATSFIADPKNAMTAAYPE
jgi:hypothetical protein